MASFDSLIKDVLPERENPTLPISKLEQSQRDKKILRWTSSLGELCETLEKDKQSEWIPNIILSVIYRRISKKQNRWFRHFNFCLLLCPPIF